MFYMISNEQKKDNSYWANEPIRKLVYRILDKYHGIPIKSENAFNSVNFTFSLMEKEISINSFIEKWNTAIIFNLYLQTNFLSFQTQVLDASLFFDIINTFNIRELFSGIKFCYSPQKRQIFVRQVITFSTLQYQINESVYLCHCFTQIIDKIEQLLTEIKNQYEQVTKLNSLEESQSKVNLMKTINHLKEYFEKQRIKRQKSTKFIDLFGCGLKFIDVAQQIYASLGKNKSKLQPSKVIKTYNHSLIEKCYSKTIDAYKQKKNEEEKNNPRIVLSIQVQMQKQIEEMQEIGSFGLLQKIELHYYVKESVYKETAKLLENTLSDSSITEENPLMKKNIAVCKRPQINQETSFFTEKAILLGLRGKKSQKIAQYYFQMSEEPFLNNRFYSQFYSKSFTLDGIALKYWLKLLYDVIQGIQFLQSFGMAHRDLKPSNILISDKIEAKIIDFGSACPIISFTNHFKPVNLELKATKNYYRPYWSLPEQVSKKYSQKEYEQNVNFDIFSYGRIIEKIVSGKLGFHPFIQDTLKYIMKRCLEANPEDRISSSEIIVLFQYLQEMRRKH